MVTQNQTHAWPWNCLPGPDTLRYQPIVRELPGEIEPGMVLCVESYIGDPETRQGVKLEDQFLIHHDHVEQMSTYPLDPRLSDL